MSPAMRGGLSQWTSHDSRAPIRARGVPPNRPFFNKMMNKSGELRNAQDGARFFAAMMEFRDDPVDLLFRLTGRQEDGERQLRTALSLVSEDPQWVSRLFLPFLSLLGVDALGRGACRPPLLRLLCSLFNFPGMLEAISVALQAAPSVEAGPEAPTQWSPVGWFLLTVATESTPVRAELSSNQQELGIIMDRMQQLGGPCAKAAEHLQVVLGVSSTGSGEEAGSSNAAVPMAVEDLHIQAGGRHSNDSPDFRAIKIMPTPDEALSSAPPHIPSPDPAPNMPVEAALLDRQFRLMREDFVGPLRAALAPLQQSSQQTFLQQQQQQQQQRRPQASSSFTSYRLICVKGSRLEPRPCVLVQVQLPLNHPIYSIRVNGNPADAARKAKDARTDFWNKRGKGTLPADALVCVVQAGKLLGFALVAWRTVEDLAAEQQPVVGLMAQDTDQLSYMLQHIGTNGDTQIVQVSSNYVNVKPILSCLQGMSSVPLAEELAHSQHPLPLYYLDQEVVSQELNSIQSKVTLDPSQARVLEMALTQRVALIQGPPGTGKTFTGVLFVESLLRCSNETILVVCYTNHALDQFLEALMDKGIEQIVRVGGRSRSKKLEPKNLRELAKKTQAKAQAERRQEWRLRQEFEELKAQAQHLNSQLASMLSTSDMVSGGQSELGDAMAGTDAVWRQVVMNRGQAEAAQLRQAEIARARSGRARNPHQQRVAEQQQQQVAKQLQHQARQLENTESHALQSWAQGVLHLVYMHLEREAPDEVVQLPTSDVLAWWVAGADWATLQRAGQTVSMQLASFAARAAAANGSQLGPAFSPVKCEWMGSSAVDASAANMPWWVKMWVATGCSAQTPAQQQQMQQGRNSRGERKREAKARQMGEQQPQEATPSPPSTHTAEPPPLWQLTWIERWKLMDAWLCEMRTSWAEEYASMLSHSEQIRTQLAALHDSSKEAVLKKARIVGCTTTGLAGQKVLLEGAVKPRVVLVEEAAELLESHVLTSLSTGTQHLVMIGDHKQLKPKVEHYPLSVQSGMGHNLNVSLFERLVNQGFPYAMLSVQHRMHPGISSMIKPTYPDLTDHATTQGRKPLLGISGQQHVVFIDHRHPEEQELAQNLDVEQPMSKSNKYEALMVVAIAKYLMQQGYAAHDLVLLTTYLGQLLEIQQALAKENLQVQFSDRDAQQLLEAGGEQASAQGNLGSAGLRVATVDNFQGEEAAVVVASLVRSNARGVVGFLKEPERTNVLLSRAREGLILLGNSETLEANSSSIWRPIMSKMRSTHSVFPGLPAACQQHGNPALPPLSSPEAFAVQCPDGGCTQPCNQPLPCGHTCSMRCHGFDKGHTRVLCKEPVFELCPEGHTFSRRCSQVKQPCPVCVELQELRDREKKDLERKEKEAACLRVGAEKKRIRLAAHLEQLQQESTVLEEQMKAQKEQISMQLQAQKLEKEIELQRKQGPSQLKVFESEQQAALEKELAAAAEENAAAALDMELKQKAAEEEVVRRQQEQEARLEAARAELQEQERMSNTEQQKVRNEAARIERKYEEALQRSEGTAGKKRQHLLTMLQWREFLSKKGQEGTAGVSAIKETLSSLDEPNAAADGIDAALDVCGLGKCLVNYSKQARSSSTAPPSLPSNLQRGISLMGGAQWLAACDLFKAATSNSSTPSTADPEATGVLYACLQLCEAKLGVPPSTPPFSPSRPAPASQHPLQHLTSALLSAQGSSSPAASIHTTGPTRLRSYSSQRSVDGQVVGLLLACLLHPRSAQELPLQLQQEALNLLRIRVQSFSSPGAAAAAAASETPGSSKGAKAIPEHWQRQASKLRPLKDLLGLTGMHAVKKDMFSLVDQVDLDKERKRDLQKSNYSCMYYGNPGTGKTTVARIYAELLKDVGVLPKAQVEETSGAALANGGANELKKKLESLKDGGVLFLDEAYQLKPKSNPMGAQVMDLLLPEMENRRGRLVVIMAGYKRHMEELISYNEGLPSRFPLVFTFADYSDDELTSMLEKQVEKESFRLEDPKHARIACRRLGRQRGTIGFGNARAVRNLLEWAIKRQSERLVQERQAGGSPDPWLLKRDDLLGPKHIEISSSAALRSLEGMRGLHSVKRSVDTLLGLIRTNAEAEEMERPVKDVCLNRIFLGNPGTGKTTVANIYGSILRDLGLLSKGDVVVKNPSDFIGTVLGESEKNTNAILEATMGSVLVIDEAYGLCSKGGGDVYKEAVIDTLVAKVQGVPGDDRCVLLLGYKQQMEDLLQSSNPGLARRFQMSNAWNFEDYSSEDLLHIMRAAAQKNYGWQLPYESLRAGIKVLDQERRRPNFGNAGSVNNLLAATAQRMEERLKSLSPLERALVVPGPEDFDPEGARPSQDSAAIFKDLVGCSQVLEKLREWQATISVSKALGRDPLQSFELNFRFVGSPGTGKTTIARRLGMLFKSLDLLSSDEVVQCSASDFTTGYVGQSGNKCRKIFESALGKVLFIDEAYRLNPQIGGPYMQEAMDEIVQLLTEDQVRGKMVVILAGYEQQIDELMAVNPGLKSRFSEVLHFPDFTAEESCSLLQMRIQADGLQMHADAMSVLPSLMKKLVSAPGWSNGRDIETWSKRLFRQASKRLAGEANQAQETMTVLPPDLEASLSGLLATKTPAAPAQRPAAKQQLPQAMEMQHALPPPPPPPPQTQTATAKETAVETPPALQEAEEEGASGSHTQAGSFGGLSNEFLQAMQGSLEALGYNLTQADIVQQLAGDPALSQQEGPLVSSLMSALGNKVDVGFLTQMVRQWQQAIQEQMEQEKELAKKKQAPVWRCAVCGRYGCPVAPYIESFQEIP